MKYYAPDTFKVRTYEGEMTINAGQVLFLSEEKAAGLIEAGRVVPLRTVFDDLFHKHCLKLKQHNPTVDEIETYAPEVHQAIQDAVKEMDTAWLREDLAAFKRSMQRVETLYFTAVETYGGNQKCQY